MWRRGRKFAAAWVLVLGCWAMASAAARAEETTSGERWDYSLAVFLWGVGMDGTTQRGDRIDLGFQDVFDDLNLGFMGALEARKDPWFIGADLLFVDVDANKAGTIGSTAVRTEADLDLTAWMMTLKGGRNVLDAERASVDLLLGARFLDVTSRLDLRVGPLSPGSKQKVSSWDAVVGVKGNLNISESWFLPYYADVGTGMSEFTWQAMGGVGYRFGWGNLVFVYRHIAWDFRSDEDLKNLSFTGPSLGAVFSF
jgi:hypothetical protein